MRLAVKPGQSLGMTGAICKPSKMGADAQVPLGDGYVIPVGGAGQLRVIGLTVGGCIASADHLGVYVGLAAM